MSNSNNQPDPTGKAIASFIIGVISVIALMFHFLFGLGIFLLGGSIIFAIIGLILGIMGLKSPKRALSGIGIILSVLSLVGNVFFIIYWSWFSF